MGPKTERFEMRLDPAILDRIDAWRQRQSDEPFRAEAIRRLVEMGLSASGNAEQGVRFSKAELLNTWLLTEILKQQKGYRDADTIELIQKAISGGHYWALDWELTGILHNYEDKPQVVSETVDILDMWDIIETGIEQLSKADGAALASALGEHPMTKFLGFCGNTEAEHLGVARFLVEDMGRFSRFKGHAFNSHMPILATYRRMRAKFEDIRATLIGRPLSVAQLAELLRR